MKTFAYEISVCRSKNARVTPCKHCTCDVINEIPSLECLLLVERCV